MKQNKNIQLIIILIIISELLLKLILKYLLNDISISEINVYNFGNILNILITILLLAGYLIFLFINRDEKFLQPLFLLVLSIISIAPLIILLLLHSLNLQFPHEYVLMFPLKKVTIGLLFMIGGFAKIYILFVLWNAIINRQKFSYLKPFTLTIALGLTALIFAFIHLLQFKPDDLNGKLKYDAAVVLGAAVWKKSEPSPIFKSRIEKAFSIYEDRLVDKIQLTGGKAPGELTEAEAAELYLISLGINKTDILLENTTSQTSQQINFVKNELVNNGFENVIIVSNDFHLDRVREISNFFGIKPAVVEANYKLSWEKLLYYMSRESIALVLFWMFAI